MEVPTVCGNLNSEIKFRTDIAVTMRAEAQEDRRASARRVIYWYTSHQIINSREHNNLSLVVGLKNNFDSFYY